MAKIPPFGEVLAHRDGIMLRIKGQLIKFPYALVEKNLLAPLCVELDRARSHGLLAPSNGAIEKAIAADRLMLAQHAQKTAAAAAPVAAAAQRAAQAPSPAPQHNDSAEDIERAVAHVKAGGFPEDVASEIVRRYGAKNVLESQARADAPAAAPTPPAAPAPTAPRAAPANPFETSAR